jgi:hypothetical protein
VTRRKARKEALKVSAITILKLVEDKPAHIYGGLAPADAKRLDDELQHIASDLTWNADGRPER